jgi:hypothetical protein
MSKTVPARAPGRGRIFNSITETIGDTHLVRLDRYAAEKGIVATLLAKRPDDRYQSAADVHRELRELEGRSERGLLKRLVTRFTKSATS